MAHSRTLILIPILAIFISALYLIADQQQTNYREKYGGLSRWYWIIAVIKSLFGFGINVVWPYVICQWTTVKIGIILTFYCSGMDNMYRLIWYFCQAFRTDQSVRRIFLCCWAATNDINTFFIVPITIYLRHKAMTKITKYKTTQSDTNSNEYMEISMQPPNKTSINDTDNMTTALIDDDEDKIFNELLAKTNYYNEYSKNPHFRKLCIAYMIFGAWFTIQDSYNYFNTNVEYAGFIRLPPFLCCAAMFLWELYICRGHKRVRFVHYSLMCLFIPVQQLYFDWTHLVVQLHEWHILATIDGNIARLVIYIIYTAYFQLVTFIGFKLSEHISITIEYVFELNFIFIYYGDMFLTMYLSLTTNLHWTVFVMIILKSGAKIITFDHWFIAHIPFQTVNTKKLAKRYLYSLLSTLSVFIGQNALLIVDFLQYSYNDEWMLSAPKTLRNLLLSMCILFMTFVGQCTAYLLIWYRSKHSTKAEYKNNYSWKALQTVPVNVPYFVIVVAMCQIFPLLLTRFFPWN